MKARQRKGELAAMKFVAIFSASIMMGVSAYAVTDVAPVYVGAPDYPHSVETRRFVGEASVTRATNGRYWATWCASSGTSEDVNAYVVLATSADGDSWNEVFVVDPDLYEAKSRLAFDPQVWVDPTGKLRWFWADRAGTTVSSASVANDGVWMMTIDDATSVPSSPAVPRCIYNGVMIGKPFVLADGKWGFPVSQWFKDPSALLVVSDDQCASFSVRGGVTVPSDQRTSDEHSIVETSAGNLRCWIRTKDGVRESVSTDNGVTWSGAAQPSFLRNASTRLSVTKLASGNLLLVKNGAIDYSAGKNDLKAFVSTDGGSTWTGGLLLDERNGATYPDVVQDPDGLIHVIYDQDRSGRREILMASFTEADAVAGSETSVRVRYRQVITAPVGRRRADALSVPVGAALSCARATATAIDSGISLSTASGYEYTLEAWVNPNRYHPESYFFSQYNGSGRMLLYIGSSTGSGDGDKLAVFIGGNGTVANQRFASTASIPLNAWTHVAMSVRRHEVRFYVNGVLDSTHAFNPIGLSQWCSLAIGGLSASTSGSTFNGRLADMRAWGRARTENEIKRDMGYRLNGNEQDLLGYWPMSGMIPNAVENVVTHKKIATPNEQFKIESETVLTIRPKAEVYDAGCALHFTGKAQAVVTDVTLGPKEAYTLEAWVRPLVYQDEGVIVSIYAGKPGRAGFETNKGRLGMFINASDGNKNPRADFDLPLGVWSHVAMSRNGNDLKFYVNGELVHADTFSLLDNVDAPLVLGNFTTSGASFNGDLRDVRVWSGVRTDAQIASNRHRRLTGSEAGLRGLWLLDEGLGTDVNNLVTGARSQISGTDWSWIARGGSYPVQESEESPNRHVASFGGRAGFSVNTGMEMTEYRTWTWEAWVNPCAYHEGGHNKIMTCYGADNANGRTGFCLNGTQLEFGRWASGVEGKSAWLKGGFVPLDKWSHVALTFDNGTVTLYVNGEQAVQDTGFAVCAFPATPVVIGNSSGWSAGANDISFYGRIAEARVWNVARTEKQILRSFNHLLHGVERGLVGYWPLNESSGTSAANLCRGGTPATASCFWDMAELVLKKARPIGLFLVVK